MHIRMDVDLDATLGCGQAHRWVRTEEGWNGVIGESEVFLVQKGDGFDCEGSDRYSVERYFRSDDDLTEILAEISSKDEKLSDLAQACPGLRILRQPRWECIATYILATNVNVKRIAKMVEAICSTFGDIIDKRHSFPTPKQILDKQEELPSCRLGFRENRLLKTCQSMEDGAFDLDAIAEMDYEHCVSELIKMDGVGPKVADCVALFAFDHLESFPVDVRISDRMNELYGVTGNYRKVSSFGREKFGRYAGYAQEYLYHMGRM